MCGIAGKAYFHKNKPVLLQELKAMSEKIVHRGPDDEGFYISNDKRVGFVSRRLAIIDLSPKGHMPMTYLSRYTITYNGEIYNFQEEREALEREGYQFRSTSDTEVILALYAKYGIGCLEHLRGMFAFAIYDRHNNTVFIARDRVGVKPLKYYLDEDKLIFASELKSILALNEVKVKADPYAIHKYLLYGYVPAPYSGFEGLKKLNPGTYLFVNLNQKTVQKKTYWVPKFDKKLDLDEKRWCDKILYTLEESTRLRMISDVPIGAFLSGGVDSSAVVASMAALSPRPIKTFSVIFDDEKYSEKKYADNIVKRYKTDHHEIMAKPTSIEILPEIAYQYEEPFSDNSAVVSFMIAKETAKYVKVALNGDGADENFAGYPNRYMRLARDVDYANWIRLARPAAALKISKITNFVSKSKLPLFERFNSYNEIFSYSEINSILKDSFNIFVSQRQLYRNIRSNFRIFTGKDVKDAGLKFDLMYFLPDQLLAKIDIATMRYSLEARSPFLDYKMIELGGQMPFNLKVKGGETKYILKKALEKIVPKENLYRPKVGFTIPLDKWFKGELDSYSRKILFSKNALIKEFIDVEKIKPIFNSKDDHDFRRKIWSLMMLELWLKSYFG